MVLKPVYALVRDLFFATKIVKTAEAAGLKARTFDSAERLVAAATENEPSFVMMDCETLEREAFRALEAFRRNPTLSKIPRVGFLTHGTGDLKRQMQDAGCEKVCTKSEFTRELETLMVRYGNGIPSRI